MKMRFSQSKPSHDTRAIDASHFVTESTRIAQALRSDRDLGASIETTPRTVWSARFSRIGCTCLQSNLSKSTPLMRYHHHR
jgi:hypothetical protein